MVTTNADCASATIGLDKAKKQMGDAFAVIHSDPMNLNNLMEFLCAVSNRIELIDTITRHLVTEGCKCDTHEPSNIKSDSD